MHYRGAYIFSHHTLDDKLIEGRCYILVNTKTSTVFTKQESKNAFVELI